MKKTLIIIVLIVAFGVAYYLISPLFISKHLDEALPIMSDSGEVTQATTNVQTEPKELVGVGGHSVSGTVRILSDGEKNYVRYENFKTINGPDIFVYLAKDLDAKDFVSLGKVRATEGNVNYEIPSGINPTDYKYVMIWCKAFGVLFNYAEVY